MKPAATPVATPWMWTLAFGHHEAPHADTRLAETREAALAAFANSWRRECKARIGRLMARFRTIQVYPKDQQALPGHVAVAVCWPNSTAVQQRNKSFEGQAYFASLAAFWIRAATSFGCERKIAWLP